MNGFHFPESLYTNYEIAKLSFSHPFYINFSIYASLLLAAAVTLKKKNSTFLDYSQTEQLKGLAMLFVIIGHFWYHVCGEKDPLLVFGDYAVTLFLLLSGYGLTKSNMAHGITARIFFIKRVKKILIPYWITTIIIILLDYFLLQKHYQFHELILTICGINTSDTLQNLDYVRWFITLLLLNYFAFFFCSKSFTPLHSSIILSFFAIFLIALRHYDIFPLGARHQLLAFPLGCILALAGPLMCSGRRIISYQVIVIACTSVIMLLNYFSITYRLHLENVLVAKFFVYFDSYLQPFLFCILCLSLVTLVARIGYTSRFLGLCGYLSYELYLIHGPFLIKYNPILSNFNDSFIWLGILLWLGIAFALAFTLKATSSIVFKSHPTIPFTS